MKKYRLNKYLFLTLIAALFFLGSCAHYQKNLPLTNLHQNEPYSFDAFNQPPDADESFVILTFSGGGTRAAAFSYGVLEEMKNTRLPGLNKTILDEADITMSSTTPCMPIKKGIHIYILWTAGLRTI